jgi:hypothetical protein
MRYLAASLVLLTFLALGGGAGAQPNPAREGVAAGRVQALARILEAIRRSQPGQLSDVQGPEAGPLGEPHYRIKWLTPDGRVLWLDTDARTGQVLGIQGGGQIPLQDRFPLRPRLAPGGPNTLAPGPNGGRQNRPAFEGPQRQDNGEGTGRGPGRRPNGR